MTTEADVEQFLKYFHQKLRVFHILFRDERGKNQQALLQLELTRNQRIAIIEKLEIPDYCEGPLTDEMYGIASMWVFGKMIKEKDVYIKISMGQPNAQVICISFHVAEKKMVHPFKPTKT